MEALAKSDFSHSSRCTLLTLGGKHQQKALIFSLCLSASFPNIPHSQTHFPDAFVSRVRLPCVSGLHEKAAASLALFGPSTPAIFSAILSCLRDIPQLWALSLPLQTILTSNSQEIGSHYPIPSIVPWNLHSTDTVLLVWRALCSIYFHGILRRHHLSPP